MQRMTGICRKVSDNVVGEGMAGEVSLHGPQECRGEHETMNLLKQ